MISGVLAGGGGGGVTLENNRGSEIAQKPKFCRSHLANGQTGFDKEERIERLVTHFCRLYCDCYSKQVLN